MESGFRLVVKRDLTIHRMDAVTAFLQGKLKEVIYMRQSLCFSNKSEKLCRLKKFLYGIGLDLDDTLIFGRPQ